jgi:glycine oxidase
MRGEEVSSISPSTHTTDVAIVGGGAIGLACAWRLAQRGPRVTVIDESVGRGASWAAAGMLAPVSEVHHGEEALLQLNLASSELYPNFAAELEEASGRLVGYHRCGTLMVARDRDDNAALEDVYRFQVRLGLTVDRLSSSDARRLEPALSPRVRGGILVDGDHQIDNRALVGALEEACVRSHVRFVRSRAETIDLVADRVVGVKLSDGDPLRCEHLVLAAGAWSPAVKGLPPDARPPLRPIKGQLLHLRIRTDRPSTTFPLSGRNITGSDVYLVVRPDGRVVIGASTEEQGFDTSVTAGAVLELLQEAYELVPGVTELELTETVAGLRPATPDNAPLIGAAPVEGLILAAGHYRNGILLTPITADAVTDLVLSGKVATNIEPFSPQRFQASFSPSGRPQ